MPGEGKAKWKFARGAPPRTHPAGRFQTWRLDLRKFGYGRRPSKPLGHSSLTDRGAGRILLLMSWTRCACLFLVLSVVVLSVCLVPVGRGPFPATHGPLTKFQAIQWLFLLLFLMAAIGTPFVGAARPFAVLAAALSGTSRCSAANPPADGVLRC